MDVEFDLLKDSENLRKHGVSLSRAEEFELGTAFTRVDDRKDYGEIRYRSIGLLNGEAHVLVFTMRGDMLRAISLRMANRKECKQYAENT